MFELRQYTLCPHVRDAFVSLFDAEFVEAQEAAGMRVLGQFRDLDRQDVFVWIRGFADMIARHRALHAFYDGPVWAAHRAPANAMMLDSDDVLLLEPAGPGNALDRHAGHRPVSGATTTPASLLAVAVCALAPGDTDDYLRRYRHAVVPLLHHGGGWPLPPLRSLHAVNTFTRLPVCEDVHVAVTLTAFTDRAAGDALLADPDYLAAASSLDRFATDSAQRLRLAPTPRSALRW